MEKSSVLLWLSDNILKAGCFRDITGLAVHPVNKKFVSAVWYYDHHHIRAAPESFASLVLANKLKCWGNTHPDCKYISTGKYGQSIVSLCKRIGFVTDYHGLVTPF